MLVKFIILSKVAGVKVYLRQNWNFRSHAVSAYISLWHQRPMHAPHRLTYACTACIAPWHHRLMRAVTAWALLFWFCFRYTFISSYFDPIKNSSHRYLWGMNKVICTVQWWTFSITFKNRRKIWSCKEGKAPRLFQVRLAI